MSLIETRDLWKTYTMGDEEIRDELWRRAEAKYQEKV